MRPKIVNKRISFCVWFIGWCLLWLLAIRSHSLNYVNCSSWIYKTKELGFPNHWTLSIIIIIIGDTARINSWLEPFLLRYYFRSTVTITLAIRITISQYWIYLGLKLLKLLLCVLPYSFITVQFSFICNLNIFVIILRAFTRTIGGSFPACQIYIEIYFRTNVTLM